MHPLAVRAHPTQKNTEKQAGTAGQSKGSVQQTSLLYRINLLHTLKRKRRGKHQIAESCSSEKQVVADRGKRSHGSFKTTHFFNDKGARHKDAQDTIIWLFEIL
jgi:hypothetical protein